MQSVTIDRRSGVPVGLQLAWAIRAALTSGELAVGDRLPAIRDMAARAGVNVNTVRAVYERLEQDGLVRTEHGRGTFAVATPDGAAGIANSIARNAVDAGVSPVDVAHALLGREDTAERRARLRAEIAALEAALGVKEGLREGGSSRGGGARILGAGELERVRDELLARLVSAQQRPAAEPAPPPRTRPRRAPAALPRAARPAEG